MENKAYCTTCGSQIRDTANFCKYCGTPVKKKSGTSKSPISDSSPSYAKQESLYSKSTSQSTNERPESPIFGESEAVTQTESDYRPSPDELTQVSNKTSSIEPIPEEIIDVLYSRERDEDIKAELKDILVEIEKIDQRLEVGLTGETIASEQIQEKNQLVQALRDERKSLRSEKIPLEENFIILQSAQKKKEKLEEIRSQGKIERESVYQRLVDEFNTELEEADKAYTDQKFQANGWIKQLENDTHLLKDEAEIVVTRAELGEITQTEAKNRREEIEIDIYRKELAYHALTKVLKLLKSS